MGRRVAISGIAFGLLLLQWLPFGTIGRCAGRPGHYAGWAAEAYPEQSTAQVGAMIRRMAGAGANVLWIGHNNPGEVSLDKVEPGLSFAVFQAYQDPTSPQHEDAVALVRAQHRILSACRSAGMAAVLPVGYQIQMGAEWNAGHPDALRRNAGGELLDIYGGGVSASFYAPSYREAIEEYYRWVDSEFAVPYADVLLMLNLADEPIGGDYSAHAEAEFRRQNGFGFGEVGESPERQRLLGLFQSRYVVEYSAFSARLWQEIHPGLPVTISFDGGQARKTFAMPDVEALFRDTPANLVITFDAYPHDGLPHEPASEADITGLFLLARSLGAYSARYGRPIWLWAAANSWGLSQPSADPGTISDAVANGLSLALLVRQAGGDLRGVVYWNYNVKQQGLYNNGNPTVYGPSEMFYRVSESFPTLRSLMEARPGSADILLLAPDDLVHHQVGASREPVRSEAHALGQLTLLAQSGASVVVVGGLDSVWLAGAKAVLVLVTEAEAMPSEDLRALKSYLEGGGRVIAVAEVAALLRTSDDGAPDADSAESKEGDLWSGYDGLVERRGNLFVLHSALSDLLGSEWRTLLAPFWQRVLGVAPLEPAYRIVTDEMTFYYHLGPEPVTWRLTFPYEGLGYRYDEDARPVERIHGPNRALTLARREYVLLWRWRLRYQPIAGNLCLPDRLEGRCPASPYAPPNSPSEWAKRAGMPPVCQKSTVSSEPIAPHLIRSCRPAMALPVYTGSSRMPSVLATSRIASASASDKMP